MFTANIVKLDNREFPQSWDAEDALEANRAKYQRLAEDAGAGSPYVKEDPQLGTYFIVAKKWRRGLGISKSQADFYLYWFK